MDLLEDLKISLSNFNFVMIYITHKMLLKNNLNYFKIVFSNTFLRSIIDFQLFLEKKIIFFQNV